ncbi:MAG: hypothetical protein ACT4SY_03235 [Hyphomicrobiales bacterium]
MIFRIVAVLWLVAALGASARAQERQWIFDSGADDAYLIFGVPETDDVGISFWCSARSGEIRIFIPEADPAMKPDTDVSLLVSAGDETFRIGGKTAANEMYDAISIEATVSAADPLFAGFQKSDRFKVVIGAVEHVYPLIDADVAGLVALCRKP